MNQRLYHKVRPRCGKARTLVTAEFCPLPGKTDHLHMITIAMGAIHHADFPGISILGMVHIFSTQRNHHIKNP
jgi:hypothetical protein